MDNKTQIEELLRLVELDAKIRQGEIALPETRPLEALLEDVKRSGKVRRDGRLDGRAAAGKQRAKKNASRKKSNARQARWRKSWKERSLTKALEGNYWLYLSTRWRQKKRDWMIPEEEWLEHVQPLIPYGTNIELRRYDSGKPTKLDNIVVYDASNGAILFDGMEYKLKKLGAIL